MDDDTIDAVDQAIERSGFDTALTLSLSSWRREPRSEVADLIDALTAAKRRSPDPGAVIVGRGGPSYQTAWMTVAKKGDPSALPALLDGLARSVPQTKKPPCYVRHFMRSRMAAYLARVAWLAQLEPDPRIASALVDVIRKAPWSVMDREAAEDVYGSTIELLGQLGDVRCRPVLEELVAHPVAKRAAIRELFATALPPIIEVLSQKEAEAPSPRVIALLARLGFESKLASTGPTSSTTTKKERDVEALLAMVLANPDDREARQVYGDALLDRGDPRGELIALQLKANPTEGDVKRARSIQRKHDASWLGDLARVLKLRVYRDGMLAEAELCQAAVADPQTWKRVSNDAQLATIRVLHQGSASEALYRQIVFSAAMRGLQEVHVVSHDMLLAICDEVKPFPFTHLMIDRPLRPQAFARLDTKALPSLSRLTIAVEPDRVAHTLAALGSLHRKFEEIIFRAHRWYRYTSPSTPAPLRARFAAYDAKALQPLVHRLKPTRITLPA